MVQKCGDVDHQGHRSQVESESDRPASAPAVGGLRLVRECADSWGAWPGGGAGLPGQRAGKLLWFEVGRPARAWP